MCFCFSYSKLQNCDHIIVWIFSPVAFGQRGQVGRRSFESRSCRAISFPTWSVVEAIMSHLLFAFLNWPDYTKTHSPCNCLRAWRLRPNQNLV
jgi:hypothetical protein